LLGIHEVSGEHSGENISKTVFQVASEFGLAKKIRYFVSDNATDNDIVIFHLSQYIQQAGGGTLNPGEYGLCYFGHILNLVVNKFLFSTKSTALE
jgi:hypothetical protein